MIERLVGTVVAVDDNNVTVLAGGVGFGFIAADVSQFSLKKEVTVYTYVHWNQEKGPSLYGFSDELSRSLFCLIITCPKIGPAIGLALLRQLSPVSIVQDISTGNEKGLSSCSGVGPKKAELIIYTLKNKIGALVAKSTTLAQSTAADWQHVQDALASLNYSRQEISDAISHLTSTYKDRDQPELNVLLRAALAFLAAPR